MISGWLDGNAKRDYTVRNRYAGSGKPSPDIEVEIAPERAGALQMLGAPDLELKP